ncbi:BON domain-containing protein [Cognatilysobacter bugurensis]|uniref:BON domain-containing protein n=1 Tax=Cognatilysobacter bugurensis TaxID=543356 RepID=UPI001E3C45B2|nr:BON domain-containing protein [Lysobacter bugurensis]
MTSRAWGPSKAHGDPDPFGYRGQGGYGDFREHDGGTRHGAHADDDRPRGHRGRGPRATRSDASIADEVYFRLTEDPFIDASEILVNVEEAVVTLTGEVTERRMKHRAEDLVHEIRGINEVHNRIRVDKVQRSFTDSLGGLRAGDSQKGSGFSSQSPGHGTPGPHGGDADQDQASGSR